MTDHPDVVRLHDLATAPLGTAREHHSRRAARTLVSGTVQRVTLIAPAEGAELAEHDAPPAATLHAVTGRVRLHTADREWTLDGGHLVAVSPQRHGRPPSPTPSSC